MKKIKMISIFSCLGFAGCGVDTGFSLEDADHTYELDTWGSNSEVYEFMPKSNPNYTCVFLMLDSGKALGFQCFPKGDK